MDIVTLPITCVGSVALTPTNLDLVGNLASIAPPQEDTYILADALLTEGNLAIMSENSEPIIQER